MRTSTLLLAALAVALAVGTLPPALRHWNTRAAEISQRAAFARHDAAEMVRKYPLFMGSIVENNAATVAEGTVAPVLSQAWATNTVVCTLRAVSTWLATNFLVRALSPQTFADCAGLAGLLVFAIAALFIGGGAWSNVAMARTFRHNTKHARAPPPPPPADMIDLH